MEIKDKHISFNLFALTGFGNDVFEYLYENGFEIKGLYTRNEKGPYPYFEVEHIYVTSKRLGVPTHFVNLTGDWDIQEEADINLVCTFHRIFKAKHLKKALYNINIHPGLLPEYSGRSPFAKMIEDGVNEVGICAHEMTHHVDSGSILVSVVYRNSASSESDLRQFLSSHMRDVLSLICEKLIRDIS